MLRLKIWTVICVTALMVSCSEGKPAHLQSWSDATGAEGYERSFWKAIQDRDFDVAERRMAPIYTLTTPTGIAGRDRATQYFRSLGLKNIDIAELQVAPQGNDMVVSYEATLQTRSASEPQRYYMTSVWQQVKRGWIMIAHNEVPRS